MAVALTEAIDEVVTLVQAVTGIGKVYGYWNHAESEAELKEKYVSGGLIHAWVVTRESTESKSMSPLVVRQSHRLAVIGFRAIQKDVDGEQKHQEMAEAVWQKLADNHHMPAGKYALADPQVEEFGAAMFAGFGLCWYVRISVVATKRTVP